MKPLILLLFFITNVQWTLGQMIQSTTPASTEIEMKVLDVVERQNYLWIASNMGLFKVNKTTLDYKHYTTANSPLPNNHIETLSLDQYQNLWIGTYDLALLKIAPTDNDDNWLVKYYPDSLYQDPLPNYKVYSSGVDSGIVWLGTNIGLINYNTHNSKWNIIRTNCPHSTAGIWDLAINNGIINIASYNLLSFDIAANRWTEHKNPNHHGDLESYRPKLVQPNDHTIFYLVDQPNPEFIFKLTSYTHWESWKCPNGLSILGGLPAKPNMKTLTAREAPNGRIYYNTDSRKMVFYNGSSWQLDNFVINNNIDIKFIEHFYIDNNGDFWLFEDYKLIHYDGTSHRSLQINGAINLPSNNNNNYRISSAQTGSINGVNTAFDHNSIGNELLNNSENSTSIKQNHESQLSPKGTVQSQELDVTIFPNPVSNFLHLEKNLGSIEHLKIVNSLGTTVMEFNALDQTVIDISTLANGSYWLIANNQKQSKKIAFIKTN